MPSSRSISLILLGLTLLTSQGCMLVAGAAVGAGGYAYVTGSLQQNIDAHYAELHGAALDALKDDMEAMIVSEDLGQDDSVINGKLSDGRNVRIIIKSLTLKASKITIRIGTFGDELESSRILSAIQKRL